MIMVITVTGLVSVILATPLLLNEQIAPPLPQIPIVELTIATDNITKNKTLVLSTRGVLGPVVYDEMTLSSSNLTLVDMKNVTSINFSTTNVSFPVNVTARIEKSLYFYDALITVNYTAKGSAKALMITEFPGIKSKTKVVSVMANDLPYRQEAMEVRK